MKILKIQKTKSDLIILELHKKWRIIELVGTWCRREAAGTKRSNVLSPSTVAGLLAAREIHDNPEIYISS